MLYKISDIQKVWPDWYKKDSELSYDDQRFIWENTPLPKEDEDKLKQTIKRNEVNGFVYGNDSGTCKSEVVIESNWYKSEHISELFKASSNDSLRKIAELLGKIFMFWPSNDGWWLSVAQTYILRSIKWVLSDTIKQYLHGAIRKTPAHYFTNEIQYRTKRKIPKRKRELIDTIGSNKQKGVSDNG